MSAPKAATALVSNSTAPRLEALVAFLALALAPHVGRLPGWVTGLCLCAWTYALLARWRGWRLPRGVLLQGLTFQALALVVVFELFETGQGRALAGGIAVLAAIMGLKPLESTTRRDYFAAAMLGLFLVLCNLFYTESLAMAGLLLATVLAACMLFLHLTRPQESFRNVLRQAALLVLQGVPVLLVLFFVFPRLPSGMFGMPPNAAPMGFDDNMTPGTVSRLVVDETLVFRAEFKSGTPPPVEQMYWRGLTLWDYDGQGWVRGREVPRLHTALEGSRPVECTILLEPMNTPWLFALDKPVHAPGVFPYLGMQYQDHTLRAHRPVTQRRRYGVVSFLQSKDAASEEDRQAGLQLPAGGNPRARALGAQLARDHADPAERVFALLRRFRQEDYVYTLTPPQLGPEAIDDFLFTVRKGFCEHYAAAFAFTMRAAGVPTRVTLGYLGGQVNPVGGFVDVRQAEAHAWTEVALPGRGWIRVDPTAAVAPERVMIGLEAALNAEDLQRFFYQDDSFLGRWLDWPWLRYGLETLSHKWYSLVLSYSALRQFQWLRALGVDLRTRLGWLLLAGLLTGLLGGAMLLIVLWQRRLRDRQNVGGDVVAARYGIFCRRLAAVGVPRPPAMGPRDYGRRIAALRPDLAEEAEAILTRYIALQYADSEPAVRRRLLEELTRLVRRFRPRRQVSRRPAPAGGPGSAADPSG